MDIKLAYGIREGRTVHISEIGETERGATCNCTCPVCGGILVAKLGEKKQHHFSHKVKNECDPAAANETGLHSLAKEIIRENRSILVPGFEIKREEIVPEGINVSILEDLEINLPTMSSCMVDYDSVEIEKTIDDIRADAVIIVRDRTCIVEIAVKHFVDATKKTKLKEKRLNAFEIDLRGLLKGYPTREEITSAVLSDETNRYWVSNPMEEEKRRIAQDEIWKEYNEGALKRAKDEQQKLQDLLGHDIYARKRSLLRNDKEAARLLCCTDFSRELPKYPFYMDIPITGECIFSCDRRIWQGMLFDDYVYRWSEPVSIEKMKAWIITEKVIQYDKEKDHWESFLKNGKEQTLSFSYHIIRRYFDYLELLGFVSRTKKQWSPKRPVSLDPPNHQAADILKEILGSIDLSSRDIDETIKRELLTRLGEKDKNKVLEWD